jgi:hypothetical protein
MRAWRQNNLILLWSSASCLSHWFISPHPPLVTSHLRPGNYQTDWTLSARWNYTEQKSKRSMQQFKRFYWVWVHIRKSINLNKLMTLIFGFHRFQMKLWVSAGIGLRSACIWAKYHLSHSESMLLKSVKRNKCCIYFSQLMLPPVSLKNGQAGKRGLHLLFECIWITYFFPMPFPVHLIMGHSKSKLIWHN